MRSIVVDTGPLVALFLRRDRNHLRVTHYLEDNPCALVTTWPVATEAWHLLPGAARLQLARWLAAGGIAVMDLGSDSAAAMLPLLEKYRDRPMDLADASLILLADRLQVEEILTTDRRDFDIYRLPGGGRLVQVLHEP